jgi:hypothetical protein
MSAGPRMSRRLFQQKSLERLLVALADAQSRRRAMTTRLEVAREDPEGVEAFDRRRSACRAAGFLRRAGWRADSDGRWIDSATGHRCEFADALRELARAGVRAGGTR